MRDAGKLAGMIALQSLAAAQPELAPAIEIALLFGRLFGSKKREHEAEKKQAEADRKSQDAARQKQSEQDELDRQIAQQKAFEQEKEKERVDELNQQKQQQDVIYNDIYKQRIAENHEKTQQDLTDLEFSRQMRILDLQQNHKIDIVDVWNGHHEYNEDAGIDHNDWEDVETKTLNPEDDEYWFDEDENEDHAIPDDVDEKEDVKPRSNNPYESLILSLSDQIQIQKNKSDQIQRDYEYQKQLNKIDDPMKDINQQQISEIQANQNLTQNLVLTALEGLNSQELTLEEIDAQLMMLTQLIEENIPRALKLDPQFIFSQNMVSFQQL